MAKEEAAGREEVEVNEQPAKEQVVRWRGADPDLTAFDRERVITEQDWRNANITDMENAKTVSWNARNRYTVPMKELGFLKPHELDLFIHRDGNFVVEDVDSPK